VTSTAPHPAKVRSTGAVLSVVVLVALNLRLALSSLPAVATEIKAQTGWNDAVIGTLTTVPVLCMGLFALTVPRLAAVTGRRRAVAMGLIAMAVGLGLRSIGAVAATLFLSALLAGISIAILGGLVPGIVREQLSSSLGTATALWTAAMMGGAALGAAATLPLADALGGWNRALAFWAIPAVVALVAWSLLERGVATDDRPGNTPRLRDLPWRSPIAWSLTAFMTLNSIVFYSALAWIAPSYAERGYTPAVAGVFFGVFTAAQIAGALVLPSLSHRLPYRRTLFTTSVLVCATSIASIGIAPDFAPPLVLALVGFTLSGSFAMALGLLSEYSVDAASSARLTAMAFFVTYTVAAFGPFVAGAIMDAADSWPLVFSLLAGVALLQLFAALRLRKNVTVD
jgi:CP family cyanate transporter-like MFS transporter